MESWIDLKIFWLNINLEAKLLHTSKIYRMPGQTETLFLITVSVIILPQPILKIFKTFKMLMNNRSNKCSVLNFIHPVIFRI